MTIFRKQTRLKKEVIVVHIIEIKLMDLNLLMKKPFLFSLKTNYSFNSEQL